MLAMTKKLAWWGTVGSALLEAREAGAERVLAQSQLIARPVGDEHRLAVDAGGEPRVVAEDRQARARMRRAFGRHRDERGVVLLVAALDEPVVADLLDRALGPVDHLVRALAPGVLGAGAGDVHSRRAALDLVPPAALLEPAPGHAQ